jgi:hypothetical protein
MPVSFPNPPRQPPGGWAVTLPGSAAIGEVLVYATPATVPPSGATFRWPCSEAALPLVDTHGSGHNLVATGGISDGGTLRFHQPSMRSDGTGFAIDEGTGHIVEGLWTPARTRLGTDYTVAALMSFEGGGGFAAMVWVGLQGIMQINPRRHAFTGAFSEDFLLWNGTAFVLVTQPTAPSAGADFYAMRVTAAGAYTCWWGDSTSTGTFGAWNPDGTWCTQAGWVDAGGWKLQEINVWEGFASDADVEALRLELVGV